MALSGTRPFAVGGPGIGSPTLHRRTEHDIAEPAYVQSVLGSGPYAYYRLNEVGDISSVILDPNTDTKNNNWLISGGQATAWQTLSFGSTRFPNTPDTAKSLTPSSASNQLIIDFATSTINSSAVSHVTLWAYLTTSSSGTLTTLNIESSTTQYATFGTFPANQNTGWYTFTYVGPLTQAQVDTIRVNFISNIGLGAAIYRIYLEVAFWPNIVQDKTSNGFAGYMLGNPTQGVSSAITNDSGDYALTFNGNNIINTPIPKDFVTKLATSSYEFWIKVTDTTTTRLIMGTLDSNANGFRFRTNSDGFLSSLAKQTSFEFYGNSTSLIGGVRTPSIDIYDGNWHHVVVVIESTSAYSVYYDCVLQTITYYSNNLSGLTTTTRNIVIGQAPLSQQLSNGGSGFSGSLDEVAIYTRRLTYSEVQQHFRAAGYLAAYPSTNSDTETLSEVDTRTLALNRAPTDSFTESEIDARRLVLSRISSDSASESDSALVIWGYPRPSSDTITYLDSLNRLLSLTRQPTETPTLTDLVARLLTLNRALPDSVSLADSQAANSGYKRSDSNILSDSDVIARLLSIHRNDTEIDQYFDSIISSITKVRFIIDSETLQDLFILANVITRPTSDLVRYKDQVSQAQNFYSFQDLILYHDLPATILTRVPHVGFSVLKTRFRK